MIFHSFSQFSLSVSLAFLLIVYRVCYICLQFNCLKEHKLYDSSKYTRLNPSDEPQLSLKYSSSLAIELNNNFGVYFTKLLIFLCADCRLKKPRLDFVQFHSLLNAKTICGLTPCGPARSGLINAVNPIVCNCGRRSTRRSNMP